ncbi:NHLP family bacteriocin export ABC transporter peptidase/permease/ATPase subunit [Azovibrio restrictus]|uniref:NHLP family bacteriocin export ABC transporter peptidase/permease/ATPase subunit n=1 Tax=Azovibrio restrictus TaxID=146938 RepID=UPI0026EB18AF|nr:NHLP family bacteriocin export ABC transporter peptidase/permease/ATPase subunit [Azovibrio restrictus]MDD3483097.1 NHLP family bacteriocin export ABC transporter peptidase/permease/ATPase subunit [Azovibrio restrictus]
MEQPNKTPAAYWRKRTPTVLQMEAVECGAAALGILMGHYGKFVPLEVLRQACGVSRDGSKASNVVKAARSYGFEARGFRYEPAEVLALQQPVIVFWNFNHFLVLEGVSKAGVHLNDPASGPRTVSQEEFDEGFTGVTLVIAPGPDFQPGGEASSIFTGLRRRLPLGEPALLFLVLAGLFLVLPGLVLPVFSKIFIDDYLIGHLDSWIKPLLLGMGVTAILQGLLIWLQRYYLTRFHAKLAMATSSQFFWHVLRLPVIFYAQRSAGDISSRVAINNRVAELLTGELATTLLNVLVLLFYAALMFSYDLVLTLVGMAVAVLNVVFLRQVARQRKDVNMKLAADGGKLLGTSMNGLQMIETLKASGMESDFFAKWAGHHAKVVNGLQQMGSQGVLLMAVPPLLTALNGVLILSLGGLRVMDGALTMGTLVAFQSLMASFLQPVNQLVALGAGIQEMEGDMKRLDDVLEYAPDPQADPGQAPVAEAPARLEGLVELRQVSFGYSPLEAPLVQDFNLVLRPGTRVALVGASGCGKSTLSRLVMGLYEPWSGAILFDGKPRKEWPRATLVNSLAMVSQEIALFEGSIRDNLCLWDDSIPEEQLVRAAQDACIHDALVTRPGGYDAPVQEGGANFSGGQRQRLEIARALAVNPRVLVLDEATSALDPLTERLLDDNLRRRGCTCLIVAHRLSTIRDCDEIIVLDQGRVVQRGTHEEMRLAPGPYAALMQAA